MTLSDVSNVAERAKQSLGGSSDPVYQMVNRAISQLNSGGVLVDVGCGSGRLWSFIGDRAVPLRDRVDFLHLFFKRC